MLRVTTSFDLSICKGNPVIFSINRHMGLTMILGFGLFQKQIVIMLVLQFFNLSFQAIDFPS